MTSYTKKDVRDITQMLTSEARMIGLLLSTETIQVQIGNASTGIPTTLSIVDRDNGIQRNAYWLPSFTYKDTLRTQYKALEALYGGFRAVFDLKREEEKAQASVVECVNCSAPATDEEDNYLYCAECANYLRNVIKAKKN